MTFFAFHEPPQEFALYEKPSVEIVLPLNRVNVVCRGLGIVTRRLVHGCQKFGYGGCLIVIPAVGAGVAQDDQDAVRRHEIAHCAGWKHPAPSE